MYGCLYIVQFNFRCSNNRKSWVLETVEYFEIDYLDILNLTRKEFAEGFKILQKNNFVELSK